MQTLTQTRLKKLVHYEPETGVFTHLVSRQGCRAGDIAGCVDGAGYWVIKLDQKRYYAQRLAWLYMMGEWPENEIDHRDRNRLHNRWVNLRPATDKQQAENRDLRSDSTSGFRGVTWREKKQRYEACIRHKGAYYSLGLHDTIIDAVAARLSAERAFFTHAEGCDAPSGVLPSRTPKPSATRSDSGSGFRGVTYVAAKNKYLARMVTRGVRKHLGLHDTIIDAVAARLRAERLVFGEHP